MKFFADRWAGQVPLERLFWRDMLLIGTTLNLACLAAAMTLAALDFSAWIYVPTFLMALPFNFFVWQCVWNAAANSNTGQCIFVRAVATVWMLGVIVL